jgi:hypothetical protein
MGNITVTKTIDFSAVSSIPTGNYGKHESIQASSLATGPSIPALTEIGTLLAACHDDTGNEKSFFTRDVPGDWNGVTDPALHIHWVPGSLIANGDTVVWSVDHVSYPAGTVMNSGTPETETGTYTAADGDGAQYNHLVTTITLSRVGTNQTIAKDEMMALELSSTAGDTATEAACIAEVHFEFTANSLTGGNNH